MSGFAGLLVVVLNICKHRPQPSPCPMDTAAHSRRWHRQNRADLSGRESLPGRQLEDLSIPGRK